MIRCWADIWIRYAMIKDSDFVLAEERQQKMPKNNEDEDPLGENCT